MAVLVDDDTGFEVAVSEGLLARMGIRILASSSERG